MYIVKVARPILLTSGEVRLLTDIIDMNVEGINDAKEVTTVDPTVQTADELTDLMSGYEDDLVTLHNVREKVTCQTWNVKLRTLVLLSVCTYIAKRRIGACLRRQRA